MKEKKYKNLNGLLEEYLMLEDEEIEVPLEIAKTNEKLESLNLKHGDAVLKPGEAENAFKIFTQIKKAEERKSELRMELADVENQLKEFLQSLNQNKITYEKKDDNKNKITYLFWLEEGRVKCNR